MRVDPGCPLYDRSRRPYRHANKLGFQVECGILGIKREHPSWALPPQRPIREAPRLMAAWGAYVAEPGN